MPFFYNQLWPTPGTVEPIQPVSTAFQQAVLNWILTLKVVQATGAGQKFTRFQTLMSESWHPVKWNLSSKAKETYTFDTVIVKRLFLAKIHSILMSIIIVVNIYSLSYYVNRKESFFNYIRISKKPAKHTKRLNLYGFYKLTGIWIFSVNRAGSTNLFL